MGEQSKKKYGTTRANMATVMNEGVGIHCKAVVNQMFIVLLVEVGTSILKLKGYIEESHSIR